jgi:Predicted AAA-ATPase/PD-(D/E)XK nuclease superfamily
MKKKLPIGKQSFKELITDNCIYVDKTEHIYRLVTEGWYYFMSRPRRFGKSLLLSTLQELFEGNHSLFEGLWIHDKWDWSQTSPVVHLSFAKMDYQNQGLAKVIDDALMAIADNNGIVLTEGSYKTHFEQLLQKLYEKSGKIILLIDEYDKPIIDHLEKSKLPKAHEHQEIMKTFYSILKDSETYLRFVLITGVSKFSRVSIFSDLNHLTDLTVRQDYALMFGYTQKELEFYFKDYLIEAAKKFKISKKELLKDMREWYNGFSWDGKNTVYNPFGVLNFLAAKDFYNFWFSSGTPTFLAELMEKQVRFDFEKTKSSTSQIDKYSLDNLDLTALLFQTGYLTIKERNYRTGDLVLDYPNREIRESIYGFMLNHVKLQESKSSAQLVVKELAAAFQNDDLKFVRELLEGMFGDLPENLYETSDSRSERFYHSFIHLTFKFLGIFIDSEVATRKGYADSVVQTPTHVYIFEFKHQETADAAFTQLMDKDYARKYWALGKKIVGIGVNFDKKKRIIEGWKVVTLKE